MATDRCPIADTAASPTPVVITRCRFRDRGPSPAVTFSSHAQVRAPNLHCSSVHSAVHRGRLPRQHRLLILVQTSAISGLAAALPAAPVIPLSSISSLPSLSSHISSRCSIRVQGAS